MNFEKAKQISSIGLANIFGTGITAVFWFFLASEIEPDEFGMIHYYISIAGLASYIALVGTQNTITVYVAKKIPLQSTLYLISLIIGAIFTIGIIIFFDRIDTGFLLLGFIISSLVIGELFGRQKFSAYSKYFLIQKGLTLILGISFYYLFGVEGILYALALSFVFYIIRIYKELKQKIDFPLLRNNLSFVSNNYMISLAAGVNSSIDKLITMPLLGAAIVGNYSLALQIFSIMLVFPGIIFRYVLPQDVVGDKNKKVKQFTILISFFTSLLGFFIVPLIIPTIFPKYLDATDAIRILSVGLIPHALSIFYISKFLSLENSKFVLYGTILLNLILVLGIIILGPIFGIAGIAYAATLSISGQTILFFFLNKRYIGGGIY